MISLSWNRNLKRIILSSLSRNRNLKLGIETWNRNLKIISTKLKFYLHLWWYYWYLSLGTEHKSYQWFSFCPLTHSHSVCGRCKSWINKTLQIFFHTRVILWGPGSGSRVPETQKIRTHNVSTVLSKIILKNKKRTLSWEQVSKIKYFKSLK